MLLCLPPAAFGAGWGVGRGLCLELDPADRSEPSFPHWCNVECVLPAPNIVVGVTRDPLSHTQLGRPSGQQRAEHSPLLSHGGTCLFHGPQCPLLIARRDNLVIPVEMTDGDSYVV